MYKDKVVLCGASAYEQKYYFNQDFSALPQQIKDELQIMCVMYTEEIGGILTLEFDEEGNLQFQVEALEADAMFDDIGSFLWLVSDKKREDPGCYLGWGASFAGLGTFMGDRKSVV